MSHLPPDVERQLEADDENALVQFASSVGERSDMSADKEVNPYIATTKMTWRDQEVHAHRR